MPSRARYATKSFQSQDSFDQTLAKSPSQIQSKIQVQARTLSSAAPSIGQPAGNFLTQQSHLTGTNSEHWPPMHRRAIDETKPPRSAAPISLDDLVRLKPGRGRSGKGGKWVTSLESDFDKETSQQELPGDSLRSVENGGGRAPEMLLSQAFRPSQHQNQALSDLYQSGLARRPASQTIPSSQQDDGFCLEALPNGDLSVFQWSESQTQWFLLGQIDKSEVSFFTRFYDRSYSDNRANAENWRLYKAHIVATVKHLSEKRRKKLENLGSPRDFVPGTGQQNLILQQNAVKELSVGSKNLITASSTDSLPPLPNSIQEFAAISDFHGGNDSLALTQSYKSDERRDMLLSMFNPSKTNAMDLVSKINGWRLSEFHPSSPSHEQYRNRVPGNMLLQRHQSQSRGEGSKMKEAAISPIHRSFSVRPWNPPTEPKSIRSVVSTQELRRTVLHDPLKSKAHNDRYLPNHVQLQSERATRSDQSILKTSVSSDKALEIHQPPSSLLSSPALLEDLVRESEPDLSRTRGVEPDMKSASGLTAFQGSADSYNVASNHSSYEEDLNLFWYSGTTRFNRQMCCVDERRVKSAASWSHEAEIGFRLLLPVIEVLKEYNFSRKVRAAGGHDHFAPFVDPPEWCIDIREA